MKVLFFIIIVSTGVFAEEYFDASQTPVSLQESELLAQNTGNTTFPANITRNLEGFADMSWKLPYSEVKNRFKNISGSSSSLEKVQILFELRNKYILVSRNGILYRYNFYKPPIEVVKLKRHDIKEDEYDMEEALLYHVKVMTPFILSESIKARLENSYGSSTKSTVDKNKMGADIWELNGGYIFQWYEPYNKKAFTRTVDYLSAEMSRTIMLEYKDYFDAKEKKLLQELIVR